MEYLNPYIELCLEGTYSVFKGLHEKDKEIIVQNHLLVILKKGEILFREGDQPAGLICLSSGKIKVFKEGVSGRQQIIRLLRQSGLIGYSSLYSDSKWPFSAVAIEDSAICIIDKDSIIKVLKRNADFGLRLIKVITEELVLANKRIVSLTQKHIRGRLAESLLLLRDTYGLEADGKTIRVKMSREEIASLSNMTTSNAIRTLSNLSTEGIIDIVGRKISIIKNSVLEQISETG